MKQFKGIYQPFRAKEVPQTTKDKGRTTPHYTSNQKKGVNLHCSLAEKCCTCGKIVIICSSTGLVGTGTIEKICKIKHNQSGTFHLQNIFRIIQISTDFAVYIKKSTRKGVPKRYIHAKLGTTCMVQEIVCMGKPPLF